MLARVFAGGMFAMMQIAAQAPVSSIPNPVASGEWVADTGGMFSDAERARLRGLLRSIHRSTRVQFAVATVRAGGTREYALQLFRHWALGTAKDNNGLLLLLSKDERAIEIVTGKGLDAILTPAELQKAINAMRSGGNALAGVKTLGASIKGFDRSESIPMQALLIVAIVSGLVGLGGTAWFLSSASRPVLLPRDGIRQETKHYPNGQLHKSEFATRPEASFFRQQASSLTPGYDEYARTPLWMATAGLPVFAAAVAAWIVGTFRFDLEPSMRVATPLVGALSALGVLALYKPHAGKMLAWLRPFVLGGLASAAVFWLIFRDRFLSDFSFAVYAVGGFVLAAGALITGLVIYVLLDNGRRGLRYACEKCRGSMQEIPQNEIENYLREWEPRSKREFIAYFRGWRCPSCKPATDRGAYVVYAIGYENLVCAKCSKPAVHITNEKGGWTVRRCFACGDETRKQAPKKGKKSAGTPGVGAAAASAAIIASSYESSSYDNDDDYTDYSSNNTSSSWDDTPSSGGSTDGGGASGNWND